MGNTVTTGTTGTTVNPDLSSAGGPSGVQNGAPPAGTTTTPAAAPADWTASLSPEAKLLVEKKQFKDMNMALDSYRNLESAVGLPPERIIKLPEKFDSPEMNAVYDRLGRPKEATGYNFTPPQGKEVNKDFTDWAQKKFHALGLSKAQGEALAGGWNEYAANLEKADQQVQADNLKTEKTALQKEWGVAHEEKLKSAFKAAQTFGLGKEEVTKLEKALGYSATIKFLDSIGSKVGEDTFVGGDSGGFKGAMTPAMAQTEIASLKSDKEFIRKYASGDKESVDKMTRLHKLAYPDLPQD